MIPVSLAMSKKIKPVSIDCSLREVRLKLEEYGLPGLPVVDNKERLKGVVFGDSLNKDLSPDIPLVKFLIGRCLLSANLSQLKRP